MAALAAGLPANTAFSTVNRACASSLQAITNTAHSIAIGSIDIGIAGGMESMTRNYGSKAIPTQLWEGLKDKGKEAKDCVMSMGVTAENVAERWGVSREEQDRFAAESQRKALQAQKDGLFDKEIIPVTTRWTDPKDETKAQKEVTITKDDGPRATTVEKLATMKTVFKEQGGTCTAGNSSQISDGAAAVLMMRRSTATALGLSSSIMGKWAGTQVIGCAPDEMGIGPLLAIPKLLEYTGIKKEEVGIWEVNEAFAAQAVACVRQLGIDQEKVNPKGGAIALGHPLGATGARLVCSLLPEMERQGVQLGVTSACIGE
jgi:acetyl-CoA acyltransferase 1